MADDEKTVLGLHEHAEQPGAAGAAAEDPPESLAARRKMERRLVWKQDVTILPLLAMCFFFSYVVWLPLSKS